MRLRFAAVLTLLSAITVHSRADDGREFRWENDAEAGVLDLYYGEQPALRYVYGVDTSSEEAAFDTAKVFHHVYGPGTETPITKGPGGKYPHHRGLYVGWNKTSFDGMTQDFWHCRGGETQRHVEFEEMTADADHARMTARIRWIDTGGEPVILETRTVEVRAIETDAAPGYGWQIDWSTRLESERGEITLDGDRQHAGFQFRAAQYVAETNSARYIRPEGQPQQPEAVQVNDRDDPDGHINLDWVAMTYPLRGQQYTVAYFESPEMPEPSRFSERPYGRFGAFFQATVTEDEPLDMRYRLIVTAGEPPARETIQARYDEFAAAVED